MGAVDEVDVDGLDEDRRATLDRALRAAGIEPSWDHGMLFVPAAQARAARRLAADVRGGRALRAAPVIGGVRVARWGTRLVARIIDGVIVGVPIGVLTVMARRSDTLSHIVVQRGSVLDRSRVVRELTPLVALAQTALAAAYEVVLVARRGRTLGKAWMRIAVYSGGRPGGIGLSRALARWFVPLGAVALVATVTGGSFIGLIAAVAALIDLAVATGSDARRTFHDRAAGTMVIDTDATRPPAHTTP